MVASAPLNHRMNIGVIVFMTVSHEKEFSQKRNYYSRPSIFSHSLRFFDK